MKFWSVHPKFTCVNVQWNLYIMNVALTFLDFTIYKFYKMHSMILIQFTLSLRAFHKFMYFILQL